MSLLQKIYQARLLELKKEVCRDPDADCTPCLQKFAAEFAEREKKRGKRAIDTLVLNLYEGDLRSLERDITKIIVFGTEKAKPSQRAEVLRCICEAASLHTNEDFANILAICQGAPSQASL